MVAGIDDEGELLLQIVGIMQQAKTDDLRAQCADHDVEVRVCAVVQRGLGTVLRCAWLCGCACACGVLALSWSLESVVERSHNLLRFGARWAAGVCVWEVAGVLCPPRATDV